MRGGLNSILESVVGSKYRMQGIDSNNVAEKSRSHFIFGDNAFSCIIKRIQRLCLPVVDYLRFLGLF